MAHFPPVGTAAHPRLLLANEVSFLSYLFLNVTQVIVKWPKAAHFNPACSPPSKKNHQPDLIPISLPGSTSTAGKHGADQLTHKLVAAFAPWTRTRSATHNTRSTTRDAYTGANC